ncbi:MAG: xanthine dehydrogenase family protein subunit M [bacterium]|nr:xanthine dehydrogenase family protein subunit M [bacterium]MDE0287043.1 xanthine dehydrogenase family protein subunit M [bacterium]MDE0440457.1 xanthine dehydrogenase family protein subunit M [bacterium]
MTMTRFDYVAPTSIEEVTGLLASHGSDAKILAGGQSLVILLRQRLLAPAVVISLSRVEALTGVAGTDNGLEIGAMTTYSEVARNALVNRAAPVLARAAGSVGSRHIRNRGTVGGSMAHADPAGDVPVALLALDATINLAGDGTVRTCASNDWFTGLFEVAMSDDEVLTGVTIPHPRATVSYGYNRFSYREGEYPMVVASAVLGWDEGVCASARVAMGGVGAHPQRLAAVEDRLVGSAVDTGDIDAAAVIAGDLMDPPSDVRGSTDWKRKVALEFMKRALAEAGDGRENGHG